MPDRCSVSDEGGGEGWREGDRSVCKPASQLTFPCSATIGRSVRSRITSLHERLALSRIKEESVHVGEVKCHRGGAIKGGAEGGTDGAERFDATEADGEGSALLCSAWTPQRLNNKSPSAQASKTELNSSKLPPI